MNMTMDQMRRKFSIQNEGKSVNKMRMRCSFYQDFYKEGQEREDLQEDEKREDI